MKRTRAAEAYISATAKYYSPQFWASILKRAERIAKVRWATRLGRMHIEMALDEITCAECSSVIWDHEPRERDDDQPLCWECYQRLYAERDREDAQWQAADFWRGWSQDR